MQRWYRQLVSLISSPVNIIPLSIFIAKVLEIQSRSYGAQVLTNNDGSGFLSDYIQWVGVLYGITVPLILIKAWEQLDAIDREFDREADTVRILYEDLFLLRGRDVGYGIRIAGLIRKYVVHILKNYTYEVKVLNYEGSDRNEKRLFNSPIVEQVLQKYKQIIDMIRVSQDKTNILFTKRMMGDNILEKIRSEFRLLRQSNAMKPNDSEFLIPELLGRLNEIVNIRGNRINLASHRMFQSLQIAVTISSSAFLIPLYFIGFTPNTPLLYDILIAYGTLLVIFIYLIIEDLDDPYTGTWKIDIESWRRLLDEMDSDERKREMSNLSEEILTA